MAILLAFHTTVTAASAAAPQRIVSLNLCTDQIVIGLVARNRIQALSHLAADASVSAVADSAAGIPATRGEAESVLAFDPDLVLAGRWSTPATVSILERIGRTVVRVDEAADLAGIERAVNRVAEAVGERARGEAVVARLRQDLAALAPRSDDGRRPSALVYQVNGLTAGVGTLSDMVLGLAGLDNHARRWRLGSGDQVALELIAADPPDLLVLTGPTDEYRTVAAENLRHPVLARVMGGRRIAVVPWRYWLCGTPEIAQAVGRLAAERAKLARDDGGGR